jgi:hypothetical protein
MARNFGTICGSHYGLLLYSTPVCEKFLSRLLSAKRLHSRSVVLEICTLLLIGYE